MPADSEPVRLPHTWRPFGVRIAGTIAGIGLFAICAVAWFAFDPGTRAKFTPLQRGTLVAIGVMIFACGHALARSRVVAEAEHLVVVNGYRRHVYEWAEVVSINLPRGAPWAILDLADGSDQAVMGIQGSDGDRAIRAVRELKRILRAG